MNDLSPEARTLVDRARDGDDPSLDDRRRVWQAIGASVAAGAAMGATTSVAAASTKATAAAVGGTTSAAVSLGKIATWVGVGLVAGVGTMGTAMWVSHAKEQMPEVAAPRLSAQSTRPVASVIAKDERAPDVAPIVVPEAPTKGRRVVEAPAAAARAAAGPTPASSLSAETALLESARAALGRGDASTALALLEDHEREFPSGALVEERLASEVFALCGLGRRADAARVAADLLQRAPGSPLRARVLESCAYRP